MECNGTFIDHDGVTLEREWKNAETNFDSLGNSFVALVEVSSLEVFFLCI